MCEQLGIQIRVNACECEINSETFMIPETSGVIEDAIHRKLVSNSDGQILQVTLLQSVYLETPNLKPA